MWIQARWRQEKSRIDPHLSVFRLVPIGQQLTVEQRHIIATVQSGRDDVKIRAFAGSGKTFTLRQIAAAMPEQRFLYLAYNKTTQQDAEASFPENVQAITAHALAYRSLGIWRTPWADRLRLRMKTADYLERVGMPTRSEKLSPARFFSYVATNFENKTIDWHLREWAIRREEMNLLYVALTRAQNRLEVRERMLEWIQAYSRTQLDLET